jgi:hypothetical protein
MFVCNISIRLSGVLRDVKPHIPKAISDMRIRKYWLIFEFCHLMNDLNELVVSVEELTFLGKI